MQFHHLLKNDSINGSITLVISYHIIIIPKSKAKQVESSNLNQAHSKEKEKLPSPYLERKSNTVQKRQYIEEIFDVNVM